jgi:EAL domain-containing protein (putative c-di-GMP-specific phosphodiesterase class I)
VLDTACRQLAEWKVPGLIMSVNISGVQLRRPEFVADALRTIGEHGLAPSDVMLEITETMLMENTDAAVVRLHELRSLGFSLAIDDFGTGYSSLRYVRNFPVDVLKIAKPFVDGVADGGEGAAVAAAVAQLGRSLGLRLIAEGIEHEDQRAALEAMGCDLGQGYHFCRPVDAAAAGELLRPAARAA